MARIELILILSFLVGLPLLVLVVYMMISSGSKKQSPPEQTRIVHDIASSLDRMEKRIESLETIVLEEQRKKKRDREREWESLES